MDLLTLQNRGRLEEKTDSRSENNMVERIYRQVKEEIFDFFLLPGDRFTESELAERVNASRTPVREALFRLQQEGYLEVKFRNGWQVKPIDFRQFEELYDIRILLETEAVKHITKAVPAERKKALAALAEIWNTAKTKQMTDGNQVCAMDEIFHETLVSTMGNREMTKIHRSITERISIIRRLDFTQEERLSATYAEHAAIIKALNGGETETAVELLTNHIKASKEMVNQITLHKLHTARKTRTDTNT